MEVNKPPFNLQLSTKELNDTDRVVALQTAMHFAEYFKMPLEGWARPLVMAFENGISWARAYAKLSDREKRELHEYYKPIAAELLYTDDPNMN